MQDGSEVMRNTQLGKDKEARPLMETFDEKHKKHEEKYTQRKNNSEKRIMQSKHTVGQAATAARFVAAENHSHLSFLLG